MQFDLFSTVIITILAGGFLYAFFWIWRVKKNGIEADAGRAAGGSDPGKSQEQASGREPGEDSLFAEQNRLSGADSDPGLTARRIIPC